MLNQKWVLIVEDEIEISAGISRRLKKDGINSIVSDNAIDATTKLRKQKFHCIILDMKLKAGTGETVIKAIKSDASSENIPIIVMSGNLDVARVEALRGKITTAFVKPFQPSLLIAKIKECVNTQ